MARRRRPRQHEIEFYPPDGAQLRLKRPADPIKPWATLCVHRFVNGTFDLYVPANFDTDLASVPRWLQWFISPFGPHQTAALFHDEAYRQQQCSRHVADVAFKEIMLGDKVGWLQAQLMYLAVRCFGWHAWRKNRKLLDECRAKEAE